MPIITPFIPEGA